MEEKMKSDIIRPAEPRERLGHLDMLRGFALFGVLISNIEYWFRAPKGHEWLSVSSFPGFGNELASWLIRALIETKFIFIFSLLFGVGLILQMGRIKERVGHYGRFAMRRLSILLLIGFLHVALIWNGDILVPFALIGMVMIVFIQRQLKTLMIWFVAVWSFIIIMMMVGPVTRMFGPAPEALSPEIILELDKETQASIDTLAAGYKSPGWIDVAAFRIKDYRRVLRMATGGFIIIFLNMLLGILMWKKGYLRDPSAHLPRFRRFCIWALPLGLLLHGIYASRHILSDWARTVPWTIGRWVRPLTELSMILGMLVLGLAVIAGLMIVYHRPETKRILRHLEPMGRMALTSYLTQSLVLSFVFYGWGLSLYNRTGSLAGALIGIGLFSLQVRFSKWWLERFRFGPVEWLWRSVTYGRRQRFKV